MVTVAAITRTIREGSPIAMILEAGEPLPFRSSILAFQVMTIDKNRLLDLAGELTTVQRDELATTIRRVWDLQRRILVSADGTFEQSWQAARGVAVFVATPDGVRSNRVIIPAR